LTSSTGMFGLGSGSRIPWNWNSRVILVIVRGMFR
jgi:hypothetical protein